LPTARPWQPPRPVTREGLLLWVIHRFAEEFEDRAVLEGGMSLRLLDSPRQTNDLDYVFAPFASKKIVAPAIERVLARLEGAAVRVSMHSTMLRCEVELDGVAIQIEISVSPRCQSVPVATSALAATQGVPSHIVRIMAPSVALAHKLAAWNERRLLRDLYDAYFWCARVRAVPDLQVLRLRLSKVRSRLPALRRRTRMTMEEFAAELEGALRELTDASISAEIGGLVEATELPGLALRIQAALRRLAEQLTAKGAGGHAVR
jgi:hypothetical protein